MFTTTVEPLSEQSWALLRDLRLEALLDTPAAFWATWEEENRYGRAEWTGFMRAVTWFVASSAGRPVGIAGAMVRSECPDEQEVIGMWVRANERGRGTADLLLDAVTGWARSQAAGVLTLWVVHDNARAQRFYARHGFVLTGEEVPRREGQTGREVRMRLDSSDRPAGGAQPSSVTSDRRRDEQS